MGIHPQDIDLQSKDLYRQLAEGSQSLCPYLSIPEEELQEYFLHRKNVNNWSPNTMRICFSGIRFFFENVLKRDWHILGILRAQSERRLPAVLSQEEVRNLLARVKTPQNHAFWPYPITAPFRSRIAPLLSATGNPAATRWRTLALEALEFIRRFLQHVLPTGFMKVRYYGFMNASCTVTLEQISSLIQLAHGFDLALPESELEPLAPMVCPKCGGTLKLLFVSFPYLYDHFAASG